MARTELNLRYSKLTKLSVKMIAVAFFLMAGFFVQDAQAQNSLEAPMTTVKIENVLNTNKTLNFVESSEAVIILKQELSFLFEQEPNTNSTDDEAKHGLKILFFNAALEATSRTDNVATGIMTGHAALMGHKDAIAISVDTQAIIDRAVDILTD